MRAPSHTSEDTRGSNDANAIDKMHTVMDELHFQNQTLEKNILNIWQCQQETNPSEEMKVQDP